MGCLLRLATLCLAVAVTGGCASGDGPLTIPEQPLSGTLAGQAWTMRTAVAVRDPYAGAGDEYFFNMWAVEFSACQPGAAPVDADVLFMESPTTLGSYTVNPSDALTSPTTSTTTSTSTSDYPTWQPYPSGTPPVIITAAYTSGLQANKGRIAITEVTNTTIKGGAHIIFDSGETIGGQFQAAVCAQ
jgi:hypothetical protein